MKCFASIALLLAACSCTANIDATISTESDAEVCEIDRHADTSAAKFRAKDVVIDETLQVGEFAPSSSNSVIRIDRSPDTATTQLWLSSDDGDHVGVGDQNTWQSLVIQNRKHGDTSEHPFQARGLEILVEPTCTGEQACNSTGIQVAAPDGVAFDGVSGAFRQRGAAQFGPGEVILGSAVRTFAMSDDGTSIPRIDIGWPDGGHPSPNGSQIRLKNNIPAVSLAGISLALDTTVQAGIRGGIFLSRGAGGNIAGNNSGIALAAGPGFPFSDSLANEFAVFDELGVGIKFGANTNYTGMFKITPKDHFVNTNVGTDGSTPRIPSKSAACDAGGSSSIIGSDFVVKWTMGASATACVITFIQPYTVTPPTCVITGEAGAGVPTYTVGLDTINIATGVAGATYNGWCFGHRGSQ